MKWAIFDFLGMFQFCSCCPFVFTYFNVLLLLLYHSRKIISDCQIPIYVIGWNWNHNKHWPMRRLESDVMFFRNMAIRTPCLWFWQTEIRSYKYKSVVQTSAISIKRFGMLKERFRAHALRKKFRAKGSKCCPILSDFCATKKLWWLQIHVKLDKTVLCYYR